MLAPGWATTTFGEVATIVGGGTPKTSQPANFEYGEIPWITPKDLSNYTEKFISRGTRNITERGLQKSSARMLPRKSVLMSSRAPIGYVAIASVPLATNQGFKSFILPHGINSSFVYYLLLRFREEIQALGVGTTFKEVSAAKAATIPLPLPPLPEQRRIVAEIEKHSTRLDASVAALKRVQSNLKRYRASVLKSACEGKLVPTEAELARSEGRDYEPSDRLLERILSERRAQWESQENRRGKYKEPVTPDTTDLPDLPEGWVWATVAQLGRIGEQSVLTGPFGTKLKASDFTAEGIPVLTIGCLTENGVDLDKAAFVSKDKAEELKRYVLSEGDLLFSRMATVGRAGIVEPTTTGCLFNYHIMRLRFAKGVILPRFFMEYVQGSSEVSRYVREVNHGATRDGINTVQLLGMPTALPPLAEQRRIVAEVERRLSVIQQAEAAVEANLTRAERLRQSILKQAFSGKLVPQDPNDEPASVLLERIRAERAAAEAAAKSQRKPRRRRSKSNAATRPKLSEAAT